MQHKDIIRQLKQNKETFKALLTGQQRQVYLWKHAPEKWCLLEIVCHLYDEERDDFRARIRHTFETPDKPMASINPPLWVVERKYMEQPYEEMLSKFLAEREQSIAWLEGLEAPAWNNVHHHPKLGALSAEKFLANWLAHDYLHIRQITATKYGYLHDYCEVSLDYAGTW